MKALALVSGEFDSPVAAYILAEKGMKIDFIHFDPYPYSDGSLLKKTVLIFNIFKEKSLADKLYVVPQKEVLDELNTKINKKYLIIVWRRVMMRYASSFQDYDFLVTGDSLGQVASQTLHNLYLIDKASDKIVLRPLLLWNKRDIVAKSKELGFYEISALPSKCLLDLPSKFSTHTKEEEILKEEEKIEIDFKKIKYKVLE